MHLIHKTFNRISNSFFGKTQVAEFHTGRCGSTVLGDLLNAHSQIHWGGEIFNSNNKRIKGMAGNQYIKENIQQNRDLFRAPIFGFETKYLPTQHLSSLYINMDLEEYIAFLRSLKISNFIILQRKNLLRRIVSAEVSRKTKVWHVHEKVVTPTKIKLDIHHIEIWEHTAPIIETFQWMEENQWRLEKLLENDKTLYLSYEDDILIDPKIAYKKVCNFLNIPPENPRITMQRTNPFKLESVIDNFEEVQAALKNSPYEWMLKD